MQSLFVCKSYNYANVGDAEIQFLLAYSVCLVFTSRHRNDIERALAASTFLFHCQRHHNVLQQKHLLTGFSCTYTRIISKNLCCPYVLV